ncbi:MAG: ATP-dependent Clp protease proteolytic subunit, partial [bacterium]|nr:ATP-dependent Clp protease proteolytic subunit [bacterium]
VKKSLTDIMAFHTGQKSQKIAADIERDYIMNAEEARKYGLVDSVITERKKIELGADEK